MSLFGTVVVGFVAFLVVYSVVRYLGHAQARLIEVTTDRISHGILK